MLTALPPSRRQAFTFVEAVFTIAIIGIMAALAITAISNGARDAFRVVSRQQQAVIQEAVNAWVMSQTRMSTNGQETAQVKSMESVRTEYNNLSVTSARFEKIKPFLDPTTVADFEAYKQGTDRLKSAALDGSRQYLSLPNWTTNSGPAVELLDE